MSGGGGIRTLGTQTELRSPAYQAGTLNHSDTPPQGRRPYHPSARFFNIVIGPGFRSSSLYSRRRSALIAALSAGSLTPTARATWPHRIARRLDGRDSGHFVQASTSRSSASGRCLFAHRWQAIRSVKTFVDITKTRPDRSQPWKCFSLLMCEM